MSKLGETLVPNQGPYDAHKLQTQNATIEKREIIRRDGEEVALAGLELELLQKLRSFFGEDSKNVDVCGIHELISKDAHF